MSERESRNARDVALVMRVQARDEDAACELFETYKNLLHLMAEKHLSYIWIHDPASTKEDLLQVGALALYRAAMDYRVGKGASYLTFAHLYVQRAVYNYAKAAGIIRRPVNPTRTFTEAGRAMSENGIRIANQVVEIESRIPGDTNLTFADTLQDTSANVEDDVLQGVYIEELLSVANLTRNQLRVLLEYYESDPVSIAQAERDAGVCRNTFNDARLRVVEAAQVWNEANDEHAT